MEDAAREDKRRSFVIDLATRLQDGKCTAEVFLMPFTQKFRYNIDNFAGENMFVDLCTQLSWKA